MSSRGRPRKAAPATHTVYAENVFRRHGALFRPYLPAVGLDESILLNPATEIPLARYVALWELMGHEVDPSIGLRIGIQTDSRQLGVFGHALRSAPTMPLVLRCLSHFIVVMSQATRVDVTDDGALVILSYQVTDPSVVQRRQDAEFALGTALNLLREVSGDALVPVRVDFEHAQPADLSLHREVFQCPLHFRQVDNRLYFNRDILGLAVQTADSRLFEGLEPVLEQQRKTRSEATHFLSRLGHHVASSLNTRDASLAQVAKSLGMSQRSLQRQLEQHDLAFGQLVEQVRRSLAQSYLTQTDYSLVEVALLLGYAESSSFSRAFRRWLQISPRQFRLKYQNAVDIPSHANH